MNAWDEILAENAADHEATLLSEECPTCGVALGEHINHATGGWRACWEKAR